MRPGRRATLRHVCVSCFVSVGVFAGQALRADNGSPNHRPPDADRREPFRVEVRIGRNPRIDGKLIANAVDELAAVWKQHGVAVVPFGKDSTSQPATSLTLSVLEGLPVDQPADALGWIGFNDDATPAPVIFLSVLSVRGLVEPVPFRGLTLTRMPEVLRDRLIARALGRTAAHELGHYLLASRSHTESGLMRPRFRPQELIESHRTPFRLEKAEGQQLAARVRDRQFLSASSAVVPQERR